MQLIFGEGKFDRFFFEGLINKMLKENDLNHPIAALHENLIDLQRKIRANLQERNSYYNHFIYGNTGIPNMFKEFQQIFRWFYGKTNQKDSIIYTRDTDGHDPEKVIQNLSGQLTAYLESPSNFSNPPKFQVIAQNQFKIFTKKLEMTIIFWLLPKSLEYAIVNAYNRHENLNININQEDIHSIMKGIAEQKDISVEHLIHNSIPLIETEPWFTELKTIIQEYFFFKY